jgi:monoamine oxidase
VPLEAQSYLGNLAQVKGGGLERYWSESELFRCSDGNDALARKLAEAIGPASIRLKTAVMALYVEESGVRLRCSDGSALEAEHAVLAVPPSVWRKIAIHPQLPAELRPQMGINVKYLAAVKERFWRGGGASANTSSDGMITCTWEGTDGQPGPGAALVAFSGGPAAQTCRTRWKASQDTAYRAELARLLAKFGEHAEGARFLDWVGDPWCGAGYSFPAPGQVTTVGPVLRKGLGRLQFAGEHACYAFVGYMEGALQSGAAAARRIAARDGVRISLERAA